MQGRVRRTSGVWGQDAPSESRDLMHVCPGPNADTEHQSAICGKVERGRRLYIRVLQQGTSMAWHLLLLLCLESPGRLDGV